MVYRQGDMRASARVEDLVKREELKIVFWVESEDSIMLFVSELNADNLMLNGTVINGKKVYVKKVMR